MNETQTRIFNFINYLCNSCVLHDDNNNQLHNMPVLLTRHAIANKLCLSERTVQRNLDWLVANKYIYRLSLSGVYIYNTIPITSVNNVICRIRYC